MANAVLSTYVIEDAMVTRDFDSLFCTTITTCLIPFSELLLQGQHYFRRPLPKAPIVFVLLRTCHLCFSPFLDLYKTISIEVHRLEAYMYVYIIWTTLL